MDSAQLRINGNVISELSEKIPTILIAMEELIKNAYDAGARNCWIEINTVSKQLVISDDGEGMDREDISSLFHIAQSKKTYGSKNKYNRFTQGSKGLGFLSVFKFGNKVIWETKKEGQENGVTFFADFEKLRAQENLLNYTISLEPKEGLQQGTKITISLDDYAQKTLENYFSEAENKNKLIGCFLDPSFKISFRSNGKQSSSDDLPLLHEIYKEGQFLIVHYDQATSKIKFRYKTGDLLEKSLEINDERFSISLDLILYILQTGGSKKIDERFIHDKHLTPLMFFNDNLFNNYEIFNPEIMRKRKSSEVLAQMIGFVKIYSSDKDFNFNSDRTHLLQNELTDTIIHYLERLNIEIQSTASKCKSFLQEKFKFIIKDTLLPVEESTILDMKFFEKYIRDEVPFKDIIFIEKTLKGISFRLPWLEAEEVTATFVNPTLQGPPPILSVAKLELKRESDVIYLPSNQINLLDYIKIAIDSTGKKIPNNEIVIEKDGIQLRNTIIESVELPETQKLTFKYTDNQTGNVIRTLELIFKNPVRPLIGDNTNSKIISIPCNLDYSTQFDNTVSNLINQINSLSYNDYFELIACSLRTLFDISIDSLLASKYYSNNSSTLNISRKSNSQDSLQENVQAVIDYVNNNNTLMGSISTNTNISFHTLKNELSGKDSFSTIINKAHLGAHSSTKHVTYMDVEDLAKKAAIFLVIINELCKIK